MKKNYLVWANQQEQVRIPPRSVEDTRDDTFHYLDVEIRDGFQKLGLTGCKRAKVYSSSANPDMWNRMIRKSEMKFYSTWTTKQKS